MGNGVSERIDNWVTGTVQHSLLLTLYFVDRGWCEGHQRWSPCGRQGFDIPPHDCWCSPRVSMSSLTAWTHETKEKSVSLSDKLKVSRCIYGEKSIRHYTVHHSYTIASLNSNFTCQNGRVSSVLYSLPTWGQLDPSGSFQWMSQTVMRRHGREAPAGTAHWTQMQTAISGAAATHSLSSHKEWDEER